ncbi:hypothetical protein C2845_PM07G30370 [Panicum miliaceum]|uniref:UspA domain-containing protein n=1 Tax=Panicum miliaceum TaxID=4540 RepID=A0A3L6SSC2_PANMI|nr:hypothetical protein C2845_PM07G30370 [Panicum miliaceum]
MPPPVLVTVGRKIGTVGDAGNPFFHHRGPRLPLLRALLRAPSASGCGRPQRYGLLSGRPPASVVIVAAGQKIGSAPVRGIATWSQLHREPCSRLSPVVGDPKEKICEVTTNRNADLLVMGCRAIWLLKR